MNINEIKDLIKAVSDSELTAFDYEEGNIRITFRKGNVVENIEPRKTVEAPVAVVAETKKEEPVAVVSSEQETGGNYVVSPLVGTAYLAPEEGAEPFVKVGDTVKKGQTLAIVEAMKLMNEIESEFDGVVKEILVENAKTVEYGQKMFVIG